MKANQWFCVLLLLVWGCGCDKQPASSTATNQTPTNTAPQLGAATNAAAAQTIEGTRARAEKGDLEAQCELSVRYSQGDGVAKDYVEAVKWCRKAAAQNLADAQYALGCFYAKGQGVPKDDVQASYWYEQAAGQGLATAKAVLAQMADEKRRQAQEANAESARRSTAGRQPRTGYFEDSGIPIPELPPEVSYIPDPVNPGWRTRRVTTTISPEEIAAGNARANAQALHQQAIQQNSPSQANIRTVTQIVVDYNKTHKYLGDGIFVCGDMAKDVWNMVIAKGINAEIVVGNVERDISSTRDANHVWVMAEVAPNEWLALETTGGFVVELKDNSRYYRGRKFVNPKEFRDWEAARRR